MKISILSRHKITVTLILCFCFFFTTTSYAASKQEIDTKVKETLARFKKDIGGADSFLKNAKGVLVFPEVIKAGIGIGGEYGEGALLINGKTVDYYSTASASIGYLAQRHL